MKKLSILYIFLSFLSFSSLNSNINDKVDNPYIETLAYQKIKNPELYKSYLLADSKGNAIIYDNINEVRPLASLTKLMTAMVVLDNVRDLDTPVVLTRENAKVPYGARLKAGKTYTVRELLELMLIRSTNSAAKQLADYVSKDNFANLMNAKAQSIGATTAHFCTPNGLPPKYTKKCMDVASAKDMYFISRYAIENYPVIREITSTKRAVVSGIRIENTNQLLGKMSGIVGIKTGFHNAAGYNMSILYDNQGNRLYEIILGSDSDKDRSLISEKVLTQFGGRK